MTRDVTTLEGDPHEGESLLQPVMRGGKRVAPPPSLREIRERVQIQLTHLPQSLRPLEAPTAYIVEIAQSVRSLAETLDQTA